MEADDESRSRCVRADHASLALFARRSSIALSCEVAGVGIWASSDVNNAERRVFVLELVKKDATDNTSKY